jgi:hypothetical protein
MSIQPVQYYQPANLSQLKQQSPITPNISLGNPFGDKPPSLPEKIPPQVASVPPRPIRPLTQPEVDMVNFRLMQSRPIKKKGLDLPMTNLIASPQKQSLYGAFYGGWVGLVVSSLLMDTIYKASSPAARVLTVILSTVVSAGLMSLKRSKKTQAQNEFAITMLQHGVTQYDSMPRGIGINRNIWRQLNGVG